MAKSSDAALPMSEMSTPENGGGMTDELGTPAPSTATTTTTAGTTAGATAGADSELLNRVVQGAHQAIDRLAETAAPHVQRLQQGVASASDALHERAGQAREMGDEWVESLRTTVRENPLAAVATAVVAGLLIARLTRR